jgi:lysyl-tRNA synthetase class I
LAFGSEEHVRLYSYQDYPKRLKSVGFNVKIIRSKDYFSEKQAFYYGFNNEEDFFFVNKK